MSNFFDIFCEERQEDKRFGGGVPAEGRYDFRGRIWVALPRKISVVSLTVSDKVG
jgi:hypothetical protein